MSTAEKSRREKDRNRQIVGFSLTPEFAAEVKMEASRRNISLQELLREMWVLYKNKRPA